MHRIVVPQSYGQRGVRPLLLMRCIISHNTVRTVYEYPVSIVHDTHEISRNDVT